MLPGIVTEEEVCGAMQFLKEEHAVDRYSYPYAGSESVKRQKGKVDMDDHPLLFTEDQVPLADSQLLGKSQMDQEITL